MELPILFISVVYLLVCVIFGLIWYIYTIHENAYFKEQDQSQERIRYITILQEVESAAATERKDLYDRLQAGTLPSYKEHVDSPNEVVEESDADIVDLDEAKDELMGVTSE